MVAKSKISKAKHNNQKKNKLVKKGVIKSSKKSKGKKFNAPKPPKEVKNALKPQESDEEESDDGQDMLNMVEPDDLEYMKTAVLNQNFSIYNKVRRAEKRKRKPDADEEQNEKLEEDYENETEEPEQKRSLLPIKSKHGLIKRSIAVTETNEAEDKDEEQEDEEQEEEEDSDAEYTIKEEGELDLSEPISTAQLLAKRNEALEQKKMHIGVLSSGLIETPEEKIMNFNKLLKILEEDTTDASLTTRKLVIVALLEVFKDLLPSYNIKHHEDTKEVKLKKDTLKLQKYETTLLQFYKKYLQKLEKYCEALNKKFGDNRKRTPDEFILAETSVQALCDLLVTHPYFNYSENITQVVVPFLNNRNKNIRETVKAACKTVFKEDKKDEITLKILLVLNQYLRTHAHNVNPDMIEVLLALKIKDVNLDQAKEQEQKHKKLMSHKANVQKLSKRERKRKKKLQGLEQELLETKAEENRQSKQKNVTEVTKILFGIYFRILKSSSNTKVLGVCLEGLAKFAHCINFEFYVDIVNVLEKLLKEDFLGYKERLFIIQTVFTILSGIGEALNMDPIRFYNSLYENLLDTNAGRNHENLKVLLDTLTLAVTKRRKKITNKRLMAFVKRLSTLSLQLLHNGTLGCLAFIRSTIQLNRGVDILLDLDNETGEGQYQPLVNDPEYSNAASSYLYELRLLSRHYHPTVREYALHVSRGCPSTGDGALALQYANKSPDKVFEDFSMAQMGFAPSIPAPKKNHGKNRVGRIYFRDKQFKKYCFDIVNNSNNKSN